MPDKTFTTEDTADVVKKLVESAKGTDFPSLAPLTSLLYWDGKPVSLQDHFQFQPIFGSNIPASMILMCGRQEGKSLQGALRTILLALTNPYLRQLVITPLRSQIERYSREDVETFIDSSPLRHEFVDKKCRMNIMERNFINNSAIVFSFAFLDAIRLRSISGIDMLHVDEVQNMNPDFIPIVQSTMQASLKLACTFYSGTPLSIDNQIELLWEQSSMGSWTIQCPSCRRENVANIKHDAIKMIGKKGPVCVECDHLLDTRKGYFLHENPEKLTKFPGYNIGQIVHPYHCEYPHKWALLLHYMETWDEPKFVNEIIGGSIDNAGDPLTKQQLVDCCDPEHPNEIQAAADLCRTAEFVLLSIDWSGNSVTGKSTTGINCIVKLPGDPRLRIVYMERRPPLQDHMDDANRIKQLSEFFEVDMVCHDYGGGGDVRETTMRQEGLRPGCKIIPIELVSARRKPVMYLPKQVTGPGRRSYMLDKARALDYMYALMRKGQIILPSWNTCKNLADDFLNNAVESHETPRSSPYIIYVPRRGKVNDIAMSALLGLFTGWWLQGSIPNLRGTLSDEEEDDMDSGLYN